jgi:DNA (cytosine-5)-methyltransferase 1
MEATQLSLFPDREEQNYTKKQKQAKLGRYQRIQRELETNDCDSYKKFLEIGSPQPAASEYKFVDLFCGAGGMTQGLVQAGLRAVASLEVNPIATATHLKNFPKCHHFSGDIQTFDSQNWLAQINSPEVHLVVGGPPCQGFSVAGKRNPNDPRNSLFKIVL